jgi:hypothetical protein
MGILVLDRFTAIIYQVWRCESASGWRCEEGSFGVALSTMSTLRSSSYLSGRFRMIGFSGRDGDVSGNSTGGRQDALLLQDKPALQVSS